MDNLIIDIGNTRIKSALFKGTEFVNESVFIDLPTALQYWKGLSFQNCLISSVKWTEKDLKIQIPFPFKYLSNNLQFPIGNAYGSPATLGLDRMAAAVGGWQMAGTGPVLVIDMGSCMTFDLVDESNTYRGGAISPGLLMRAKAMNALTARLPLVEVSGKPEDFIGTNTISCMQIGIWYGIESEILGQIQKYEQKFPQIKVFVCGGDAQSFESLAKDHIFVVQNLVLHGLNCILNHNVE
ncbi:type III pantothenate kinase [Algoriphagus halophilus]|uniref:Type III pantothenate kinase n=1 Tax=Algoriphagus halophilus TaxID=226505 RepID=A0A1N6GHP1_9BACT|nr:type III pantothenate kinase [Algoriphagus halophilus]SIO07068.1 type III pantothenate kinase [Algoriphagus halophilus]